MFDFIANMPLAPIHRHSVCRTAPRGPLPSVQVRGQLDV
jgi:hypothetical protein